MANIFHVERAANKITLGTTGTTINVASHTASRLLALDASKDLTVKAIGADVQAWGGILDDLNTLGVNAADSEFLVGTGAGALAWESGATVRTSIGLGTGDGPTFGTATLTHTIPLTFSGGTRTWITHVTGNNLIFAPRNDGDDDWDWTRQTRFDGSTGNVSIKTATAGVTALSLGGTLTLKEQASADGDTISYGQIWVKAVTPNELWFTDDAGTDHQIAFV